MTQSRSQRESLSAILRQLRLQSLSRGQQDALMTAVGFEEDVAFAKSLFTERVVQIYRETDGQFQKLIAKDAVALMPAEGRLFLVAVFRRYHQQKVKGKEGMEIGGLKLPDPGNIGEVIAFQKRMYELFRHLIPPQPTIIPPLFYPSTSPPKFSPFPIYPLERTHTRLDNDYPHLPYIPFSHRPSVDSLRRADSQFDRQSFISRNSFMDMQRIASPAEEEERVIRGFATFGQEQGGLHPTKRLKLDENVNFAPENVENMKKELELFAQNRKVPTRSIPIDRSMSLQEQKDPYIKIPTRRGTGDFESQTPSNKPCRDRGENDE